MNRRAVFEAWAPPQSVWGDWVKPVVFAHVLADPAGEPPPLTEPEVPWAPPAAERVAVVLDVAGAAAIPLAVALARRGYQPVPLYNAVPGPPAVEEVVDVRPILAALVAWAAPMSELAPRPPDAPPVFMLDADRRTGRRAVRGGVFDNRSVSLPTDFPSATYLKSQGIVKALLVQESAGAPQADVAHTLRRWQEGGVTLLAIALAATAPAVPIRIPRPVWYRWGWQRWLATLGSRRHPLGGFGGELPEAGTG